jgi:hypothetical protein
VPQATTLPLAPLICRELNENQFKGTSVNENYFDIEN